MVICNQTGKSIKTSTDSLSKENSDPLTEKDLVSGSQLLLTSGGKEYPVTIIKGKPQNKKPPVTARGKKCDFYNIINFYLHFREKKNF